MRKSRETLVLRIRKSEGRVVNTPWCLKRVVFEDTRKRPKKTRRERGKRPGKKPGEREERDRKKPGEKKIREKSEEEQKERTRDPRERERQARLEWRKRAESGNWSEKDDERRWR
ncbi:hypothetical protein TNCV_4873081 [Trichonephila clavipes]|nr:hypothetical protein TNCV_4873081 [Trichonephila clavipes]